MCIRDSLGIWQMMWETVNQKAKDKKPVSNMASMVMQAIISGGRYPASLYTDTLIRIKAEQGKVSWGRAGIIKAYLIKNCNWKEGENYMGLNEASEETAYVLGRLFSVLECIQKMCIRDSSYYAEGKHTDIYQPQNSAGIVLGGIYELLQSGCVRKEKNGSLSIHKPLPSEYTGLEEIYTNIEL